MPYWRLYYHVVWSTRERASLIRQDVEREIHKLIVGAARRNRIEVLAIGGIEDHVHVVISVPPSISLSDAVSRIKGASSHVIRERHNHVLQNEFNWQSEYGAVSISESQLDPVCSYVRDQRRRHADRKTVPGLERVMPR
jgi:putative transposase